VVPELEAGRVAPELEAGRELVEDSLHRVSIRDLVGAILPRVSTQAEELSSQAAELVEDFLHRVSTQEVEVLLPRVNIPVEEVEDPPQVCLPPAPGLVLSP